MKKIERDARVRARKLVYDLIERYFLSGEIDLDTDAGLALDTELARIQWRFDDRDPK